MNLGMNIPLTVHAYKCKIRCESETHSLEKLVEVKVEVLGLAAVEVETAPVAAMHIVLLPLFRVGEHFVSCNGERGRR